MEEKLKNETKIELETNIKHAQDAEQEEAIGPSFSGILIKFCRYFVLI